MFDKNAQQPSEPASQSEDAVARLDNDRTYHPMPDVGDLLYAGILYVLLFGRPDYLFQDASTGWHLSTGKWIAENKAIPMQDLISCTFADKTWVAYEWLFDLSAYLLVSVGGLNLLAVAISCLIAFIFMKVYDRARIEGSPLEIALPISMIAILASAVHWLARPHVITFAGIFIFCSLLESFYHSRISRNKLLIWIGAAMIIWCNCHPAFIAGIGLCGLYATIASLTSLFSPVIAQKAEKWRRAKALWMATLTGFLASFVNPYGWRLHAYILSYLDGNSILLATDEFQSPSFHDNIHALCLELLILALIASLALSKVRVSIPYLSVVLLFLHMALSAVRNIPLFSIIVVPFIGGLWTKSRLDEASDKSTKIGRLRESIDAFSREEALSKMRILPKLISIFLVATALSGGDLLGVELRSGFSTTSMPSKTLECIRNEKLPPERGFNLDNWGGLIRYELDRRVFIDDRSDFYGEDFYNRYGIVVELREGWREILDSNDTDWVLMPVDSKLINALKSMPDWSILCQDEAAVLMKRKK